MCARSRKPADGSSEIPGSASAGVSSRRACTRSPLRTAATSPNGTSTRSGTHGVCGSTNIHTLNGSAGTHRCSTRVYVVPLRSGRSRRITPPWCQRPRTARLPRAGEAISTHGGGPALGRSATLTP